MLCSMGFLWFGGSIFYVFFDFDYVVTFSVFWNKAYAYVAVSPCYICCCLFQLPMLLFFLLLLIPPLCLLLIMFLLFMLLLILLCFLFLVLFVYLFGSYFSVFSAFVSSLFKFVHFFLCILTDTVFQHFILLCVFV